MGTFTRDGGLVYNGNTGTVTFNNSFLSTDTASDGDPDMSWELGDTDLFEIGASYAGKVDLTLIAGGTVTAPVITTSGSVLTVIELPVGIAPGDVSIPPSLDLNTIDTSAFTTCFAAGTQIATPDGTRRVETLSIGDHVVTPDGRQVAVLWIGRQTCNRAIANLVRVRAGALGAGVPHRDLILTADHGLVLDGHVINAAALVNGDSIAFEPLSDLAHRVTVYHIETADHDVILANGTPAETFADAAGRRVFDNYAEYMAQYGPERIIPESPLPRIASARLLPDAVARRLGIVDNFLSTTEAWVQTA